MGTHKFGDSAPSFYNNNCFWRDSPQWARFSSFTRFLYHTQWRTTVGRTPLDEWSVRRRDLYLTTQNNHNRQTSMPPGGIRTHSLIRRVAADLRLRPRGHLDRHNNNNNNIINQVKNMYINTHFKEILHLNTRNMQHSKNRCSWMLHI